MCIRDSCVCVSVCPETGRAWESLASRGKVEKTKDETSSEEASNAACCHARAESGGLWQPPALPPGCH
eukprot:9896528-Alexandrium_andersonii.AAC.1